MKKIVYSFMFLVVAVSSNAQTSTKKINIGFTVSPNISSPKPVENGITRDASRFSINYGLMVDYEFADNYFFSTGIHVAPQGGTLVYKGNQWPNKQVGMLVADNSSSNNIATYKIRSQYIEVPLAIKLKTDSKDLQFWGSFGGFLGILVKGRADISSNFAVGGTNYSKENENIIGNLQPFNVGMQVGAGVEFPVTNKNRAVAGLVYNNGLIDMTRNSKWGDDGRVNLNSFTIKLGVFF